MSFGPGPWPYHILPDTPRTPQGQHLVYQVALAMAIILSNAHAEPACKVGTHNRRWGQK